MDYSRWKYDVFVSFRGEDTRNSFTSHLFKALDREGYTYFRDTDEENRGMVIESVLLEAIHQSMAALIVFSRNYADSLWCLNELVEILECNKRWREEGHLVLPIFYDVEPGEVRRQRGMFGEGFERCKEAMDGDVERIEKWKTALVKAGNLSGWHSRNEANGDEADFIKKITSQLASKRFSAKRRQALKVAKAAGTWVARGLKLVVVVAFAVSCFYEIKIYWFGPTHWDMESDLRKVAKATGNRGVQIDNMDLLVPSRIHSWVRQGNNFWPEFIHRPYRPARAMLFI